VSNATTADPDLSVSGVDGLCCASGVAGRGARLLGGRRGEARVALVVVGFLVGVRVRGEATSAVGVVLVGLSESSGGRELSHAG
jgi:hypothetical protein